VRELRDAASPSPPRSALRSVGGCARRAMRAAREQSGASLIEAAVVLPIYLLIFLGTFQYSLVLLTYCNATYACRLASRYASMHSTASLAPDTVAQIQGLVTSRLFIGPGITPTISVNYYTANLQAGSNVVGNVVLVSVTWTQTVTLPFSTPSTFSISTQNYKVITR